MTESTTSKYESIIVVLLVISVLISAVTASYTMQRGALFSELLENTDAISEKLEDLSSKLDEIGEITDTTPTYYSPELVEAAQKEGKVAVYVTYSDSAPWNDRFTEKFGIEVEMISLRPIEVTTRFMEESRTGRHYADAVQNTGIHLYTYQQEGLLQPYKGPGWEQIPWSFKNDDGYYTGMVCTAIGLGYNIDMINEEDAPNFEDLIKPEWKGKLFMHDPEKMSYGLLLFASLRRAEPDVFNETYWWTLHNEQDVVYKSSGTAMTKDISMGERPLAFGGKMEPEFTQPEMMVAGVRDYMVLNTNDIGISVNAPHPNAAKLLIDFYLSEECGVIPGIGIEYAKSPSTNPNVKWVDFEKVEDFYNQYNTLFIDYSKVDLVEELALWKQWVGMSD